MSLGKLRCAICYRKCISISALLENHGTAQTDVNKQNTSVLPHWVNTQNSMKIYEAKSMNELWEIFDEKELSSGELVSFLNCLCKLSINGTETDEFKRRSDVICQKIFNRLNQFKSGDFIIIFRCLLKLNVSPEHKIIQILEQQLLRCLHLLSVSSLISLVCFHFPFATSDESKIFQRELEMALFDKIDSITSFFSLLELWTVYGTDYNWKTALQCKMLKLTGEASLDELLKMLLHLADRSIRIPKVIDSNLLRIYNLQKENGLNLNQAISVLNSMMKLNYLKIDLVNAACDVLKDNILNLDNVNSINEIAYIFGSMKLRDESILNLLCEWFTTRLNSLAVSDLFQLVITLAQCNFENSICNKISNYLENADGRNSNAWLNVVWSLSIQRNLSSKLASTVLNSSFASKFKDDLLATLKLVNVKSAVQLEVDDYAGPEFKFNLPESCRYEMIMNRQKIDMAQILFDALNNLVPLHKYVKYQFIHQLGYAVEAELRYDLKNGIISLEDWKRSEDVCKKILLILLDQRDFTKISSKLIGRRAMMIRHFKLSGYSIATIAKAVELTMVEKPECLSRLCSLLLKELNCLGDSEKFKALILWLVKRMKDGQLPDVALSSIYIVLLNELSNLEICYVVAMTSRHMEHFQRGNFVENKWAFLLPKVFSIIAAATEIDAGDGNRLPGKELKTRLLQQFANLNLPTSRRLLLLTVLKEVEMTPSEKVNIFKPFFDHLNELNLDEIECYVNGLLHLLVMFSLNDREYVVHGLSELGFLLLDSVNLKEGGTLEKSTKNVLQNEQIALAKHLIIGNFKRHNFIRRAIIEKIIDAVMLQSSSCLYLLDVFCILIKISPMTVLESEETIIKSFSVLPVLSTESGLRYMKSLIPIIELKPAMRNSLFIALRNAIFSKDLLARKTAVNGFLLFLNQKDLINAFSSSQMSNSSQPFPTYSSQTLPSSSCAASGRISVATIFLEMISCLRRALSLQSELRRMLYIGLCKVAGNQKVLQEPVLDMLQKQFENYLSDPSKSGPPLCLEFCISSSKNGVTLVEPLGVLIASINLCLGAVQADDTGNDSEISSQYHLDFEMIDSIKKRMNTICQYMMSADLEDFNLDKSVSFSTEEIVGQRTISMAFQFLSVLEALIDFIIMDFNFNSADSAISILKLYGLHCKMSELLKENLNLKRHKRKLSDEDANSLADVHGRKGKLLSNHECCIRLSSLAVLLSHLLTDLESDHEVSLNPMREREDFMTFLFNAVKSKLTNVQIQEFNKRKDSVSVCKLARSLFLMFFRQGNNVAAEVKKYPSLVFSSLEAFSLCIDVIDNYSTSAESFAKSLSLMVSDFDASLHWNSLHHLDQIYRYCVTFTKMLRRNLNTSTDDKKDSENKVEKASAFIIRTIEKFLAYLPRDCSFYEKVFKHIWQICEEQIDMEPYVARLVWNLALSMFKEVEAKPTSLIHIAEQLHCIFGDIADGHITDESEYRYSSINARTASTVLGALLNIQDLFLEDVIYAIGHAKALRFAGAAGSAADSSWEANLKLVETSACEFLGLFLLVWHELVQSRIPVKMIDSVIKGLEKMFKVLHLFAKYHVTMVLKKYSTPNELFQQLTKRSGTHLIPYVYKMISYAQEESNSSGGKSRTSGAKAKVKIIREMRSVSKLIFALENYEQCLIDLGNRCNVNYMRTIKPSVNRDFKIDVNRARAAIRDEHEGDQQQDELENVVIKKSRKG
ncbi:Fanconi anemia group I protein [Trichinella murrelli]|uniref:Fanconi anemia group I protein n=1 Tax=Trichinella murrelli TaxID=144512 RepID=A0A0V0TYB2_9BILA|nr:Fanconi anemia group I protein [Trichinella murrelli]